jgi:hypothetical protein
MKSNIIAIMGGVFLILALIAGCSDSPSSSGTGQLKVYLTDTPAAFDQVNIEVIRVEVHSAISDTLSGWTVVNPDTAMYELLTLRNGANSLLGDQMLPVGQYTQIRLYIGDSSNVVVDGVRYSLDIPSNTIKLNHNFNIAANTLYEFTLDFDASRSIIQTGNGQYRLHPVMRVMANAISGMISGIVLPASARGVVSTVVGEDTVSAFCDMMTGGFMLSVMPVGTYNLEIVPSNITYEDTTLTGVQVMAMHNTNVGTVQLRLR